MKKASKILLIIAGVFNLLMLLGVVVAGLVFIIEALVTKSTLDPSWYADIEAAAEEAGWAVDANALTWIVIIIYIVIVLAIQAVGFVYYLVCTILSFKGAKAKKKGVLIANIVFYAFTWYNILMLVGAILGLIGLKQEANREAEANNPQPEPTPVKEEPNVLPEPEVVQEEPTPIRAQEPVKEEPAPAPVEEKKPETQPEPEPKKEEPKPEKKKWFCPNCGAENTGKFCGSCGTKRPE